MNFQKNALAGRNWENLATLLSSPFYRLPIQVLHVLPSPLRLIKRLVLIKCRSNKYSAVGNYRVIVLLAWRFSRQRTYD